MNTLPTSGMETHPGSDPELPKQISEQQRALHEALDHLDKLNSAATDTANAIDQCDIVTAEKDVAAARENLHQAIIDAQFDPRHPLSFDDTAAVLRDSGFDASKEVNEDHYAQALTKYPPGQAVRFIIKSGVAADAVIAEPPHLIWKIQTSTDTAMPAALVSLTDEHGVNDALVFQFTTGRHGEPIHVAGITIVNKQ